MGIDIWDGSQWRPSSDPEIYTASGWVNIMEGHTYIGNNVWNRFFVRVTPVAPTVSTSSRTSTSLTFNYSHPGDASGVYLVLSLVRVSTGTVVAGPENTTLTNGSISGSKTYTGLLVDTSYEFRAYAVYNSYSIESATDTVQWSTLATDVVAPDLSTNTAGTTTTQIRLNVSVPNGSPYNTRVKIWVSTLETEADATYLPTSAGVNSSAINTTYTRTQLTRGSTYTFRAKTEYREQGTLTLVATSGTTSYSESTLDYIITVPTKPTAGTADITSNSIKFTSSSSANDTANEGAIAYIQFTLYNTSGVALQTINSTNLPASDTTSSRTVTFTGLTQNTQYYCRARTVYGSPVSQNSALSTASNTITTLNPSPTSTGVIFLNNSTFITGTTSSASSSATGSPHSYARDSSSSTQWVSDPFQTGTFPVSVTSITRDPANTTFNAPNLNMQSVSAVSINTPHPGGAFLRITYGNATVPYTPAPSFAARVYGPAQNAYVAPTTVRLEPAGALSPTAPAVTVNIFQALPGNRTLFPASNRTQVVVPVSPTTSPGTAAPISVAVIGPRPGLNGPKTVTSYNSTQIVTPSGEYAGVPFFSNSTVVTSSPLFTPPAPVTMSVTGQRNKTVGGVEEITFYVTPKTTLIDPRIESGNVIRVTSGNIGDANYIQTVSLYLTNGSSTFVNTGLSANLTGQFATHTFTLTSRYNTYLDGFLGAEVFGIQLRVTRDDGGGLIGVVASLSSVEMSFTYDA